jgi:hypothetical protein
MDDVEYGLRNMDGKRWRRRRRTLGRTELASVMREAIAKLEGV